MKKVLGNKPYGMALIEFTDAAVVGMRSGVLSDPAPIVMKVHSTSLTMNLCKCRSDWNVPKSHAYTMMLILT